MKTGLGFLDYDCAWPGGDYCSAVLCDLVGGRVFELSDVPLNANGSSGTVFAFAVPVFGLSTLLEGFFPEFAARNLDGKIGRAHV